MIGLDTNILVRYLTRDDEQQWQQAVELIQQNRPCFKPRLPILPMAIARCARRDIADGGLLMSRTSFSRLPLQWAGKALVLMVGLTVLGGCDRAPQATPPAAQAETMTAVDTVVARAGTAEAPLTYTGTTQPHQQATLRARVDGEVLALFADVGDTVTAGQAIAELDPDLFTMAVSQTAAELQARRAEVAQAQAAVSDAQTALKTAEVEQQQAQADADRLARLAAEGAVSMQAAEQAQVAATAAAQLLQSAQEQIRTRQATVAAAQERVRAQQAVVAESQEQLSFAAVRSPLSGTVLRRLVDVGDYAESGDELLQVGELTPLEVTIDISDRDLSQVRVGQPVTVRLDAFPGEDFAGQVTRIAPVADAASRLIPVEIQIPNQSQAIGSGLLARVTLQSGTDTTVAIPNRALEVAADSAQPTLFVVTPTGESEATVQRRTVTLGRQSQKQTEIVSGLAPGEVVVVRSSGTLAEGQTVRLSVVSETEPTATEE